jgi:predicted protein tyrosine phosphatase
MDEDRRREVVRDYNVPEEKVVNLDIPDEYDIRGIAGSQCRRMLEKIFKEKLKPYINEIQ